MTNEKTFEPGRTYRILEVADPQSRELVGYRIKLSAVRAAEGRFVTAQGHVEKFQGAINVTCVLGPQTPAICNCPQHPFPHKRERGCTELSEEA